MNEPDARSSWNPADPVQISPEEYERQVVAWLSKTRGRLASFTIRHQEKRSGSSGNYTFDALAEFEIFEGARILVLVECKRHKNPVKRDAIQILESKLRDVGGHKAMVFSTAGFQRGALEYAAKRGVATITLIDGRLTYETRDGGPPIDPPRSANVPHFAGFALSVEDGAIHISVITDERMDPITKWLDI